MQLIDEFLKDAYISVVYKEYVVAVRRVMAKRIDQNDDSIIASMSPIEYERKIKGWLFFWDSNEFLRLLHDEINFNIVDAQKLDLPSFHTVRVFDHYYYYHAPKCLGEWVHHVIYDWMPNIVPDYPDVSRFYIDYPTSKTGLECNNKIISFHSLLKYVWNNYIEIATVTAIISSLVMIVMQFFLYLLLYLL